MHNAKQVSHEGLGCPFIRFHTQSQPMLLWSYSMSLGFFTIQPRCRNSGFVFC